MSDAELNEIEQQPEQVNQVAISDGLLNFLKDEQQQDAEQSEQQAARLEKQKQTDLEKAEKIAKGTLKGAEKAVEFWFKCNTGLDDEARQEWAEAVAPVLVEAGIKDYFGVLDKYGIYITAIVATGKIGATIAANVSQQLAEREAEQQADDNAIQAEASGAPVQTYQQDFKGRGGFVDETVKDERAA